MDLVLCVVLDLCKYKSFDQHALMVTLEDENNNMQDHQASIKTMVTYINDNGG